MAVCGLGGHPIGSFRYNKGDDDFIWLCDDLPLHLTAEGSAQPCARIMTYGHGSVVPGGENAYHLGDIATILRESLMPVGGDQPLIFIAHSLGGLVVKEVSLASLGWPLTYSCINTTRL